MPFIRIDGFTGLVYVPDFKDAPLKKHDCADCAACLHCSDDKCALCTRRTAACACDPVRGHAVRKDHAETGG
ncbi:MAG: hypothetical protein AB2L13_20865 [Spirochaetota bacterium]|jgi:hypothetical protein